MQHVERLVKFVIAFEIHSDSVYGMCILAGMHIHHVTYHVMCHKIAKSESMQVHVPVHYTYNIC